LGGSRPSPPSGGSLGLCGSQVRPVRDQVASAASRSCMRDPPRASDGDALAFAAERHLSALARPYRTPESPGIRPADLTLRAAPRRVRHPRSTPPASRPGAESSDNLGQGWRRSWKRRQRRRLGRSAARGWTGGALVAPRR
jgi:hypothetical protein